MKQPLNPKPGDCRWPNKSYTSYHQPCFYFSCSTISLFFRRLAMSRRKFFFFTYYVSPKRAGRPRSTPTVDDYAHHTNVCQRQWVVTFLRNVRVDQGRPLRWMAENTFPLKKPITKPTDVHDIHNLHNYTKKRGTPPLASIITFLRNVRVDARVDPYGVWTVYMFSLKNRNAHSLDGRPHSALY